MFFASNGLQSMGGFDVFRNHEKCRRWMVRTGAFGCFPVNSVDDDMAFVMGAKGEVGYFSSRQCDSVGLGCCLRR